MMRLNTEWNNFNKSQPPLEGNWDAYEFLQDFELRTRQTILRTTAKDDYAVHSISTEYSICQKILMERSTEYKNNGQKCDPELKSCQK